MGNAKYERARARARLALIAPIPDDVSAIYFERQVTKALRAADQGTDDHELLSAALDALARRYFARKVRMLKRKSK